VSVFVSRNAASVLFTVAGILLHFNTQLYSPFLVEKKKKSENQTNHKSSNKKSMCLSHFIKTYSLLIIDND